MSSKKAVFTVGALGFGIAATLAYRIVFQHPGEEAIRYIPNNARLVVSLDLTPSAAQVLEFDKLKSTLDDPDVSDTLKQVALSPLGEMPLAKELIPFVKRGGVMAMLHDKEDTYVLVIAVSEPDKVEKIIAKNAQPKLLRGVKCYQPKDSKAFISLMGTYIVMSDHQGAVADVRNVYEGYKPSILSDPAFAAARQQVGPDGNLTAYYADDGGTKDSGITWMTASLGIREGGLALEAFGQMHPARRKDLNAILAMNPLRADLMQILPENPYMVLGLSQVGEVISTMGVRESDDIKLSDIQSAFDGNAVVAIYPTKVEPTTGFDVLVIADDQNGADPAKLIDRLRSKIEKAPENKDKKLFTEQDGIWSLSPDASTDIHSSMENSVENPSFKTAIKDKTLTYVAVGHTVIASTSKDLLLAAKASMSSKESKLSEFAMTDKAVKDGSQLIMTMSMKRVADGLINTFKDDKDAKEMFDKIHDVAAASQRPFSLRAGVKPEGQFHLGAFIPVDFNEVAKALKKKN